MADETWVSIRFRGDDVSPDVLTALFGRQPTTAAVKGEVVSGRTALRHRTGLWSKNSDLAPQAPVEEHVNDLLAWLEPHRTEVARLVAQGHVVADMYCSYYSENRTGYLSLSPQAVSRLALLGLGLTISTYCPDDRPEQTESTGS